MSSFHFRHINLTHPVNSGSQLQRLEGIEQLAWERRTRREKQIAEEENVPDDQPEKRGRLVEKHKEENKAIDGDESAMKMV